MFTGSLTALVTPFRGGAVDSKALADLVEMQIAGGTHGLVPCGSTGESATLTHEEHLEIVRHVVRLAHGRVPVIAGTGSNSTAEAVRPTQEGIYHHYTTVAEAAGIPLILYNIPGRTASNILP